jgi:hypothetical protein
MSKPSVLSNGRNFPTNDLTTNDGSTWVTNAVPWRTMKAVCLVIMVAFLVTLYAAEKQRMAMKSVAFGSDGTNGRGGCAVWSGPLTWFSET